MRKISNIGSLLKRIYRVYSTSCIHKLEKRGFRDLRPSFLEILVFICDHEGSSIKEIGKNCGLKKQTMTSHLNELEKRGYLLRKMNEKDKREQNIYLTEFGEKFKFSLFESMGELEKELSGLVGDVELDRIEFHLNNFHVKINEADQIQDQITVQ